jgi:hypothetical protein
MPELAPVIITVAAMASGHLAIDPINKAANALAPRTVAVIIV